MRPRMPLHLRAARHVGAVLFVWFVSGGSAAGQAPAEHPMPAQASQEPAGAPEYPSLHISGFADADFAAQDKSEGARGFSLGQFVLHMASALSPRVNVFAELSFSARTDAGTGTPPAAGYNDDVEPTIIRF